MKRFGYIVLCAIGLTACASTVSIPIDDAYIWQEKTEKTAKTSSPSSTSSESSVSTTVTDTPSPATPQLEFLSVQDTTITVRIKK